MYSLISHEFVALLERGKPPDRSAGELEITEITDRVPAKGHQTGMWPFCLRMCWVMTFPFSRAYGLGLRGGSKKLDIWAGAWRICCRWTCLARWGTSCARRAI